MSNNYWETKTPECFAANPPCCWSKTPELQLKCLQQPTNEVCLNSAEGKVERREKEMMFSHYLPEQHGGLVQYSAQSPFYICSQESRTCSVYTKMYLNINVYFTSENFFKPRLWEGEKSYWRNVFITTHKWSVWVFFTFLRLVFPSACFCNDLLEGSSASQQPSNTRQQQRWATTVTESKQRAGP